MCIYILIWCVCFTRVFVLSCFFGLMCWVCFSVVFLALWCALRCWRCLFLSHVTLLFLSSLFLLLYYSSLLLPNTPPPPTPAYLILGCWFFAHASLQFSSPMLAPFSTPPAPSPNGPPSPKFGRDPLSYCLKEINKTVKPRISSFRTLRRSVSHHRRRFGCPETFTHEGSHIILCSRLCKSHWIPLIYIPINI